MSRNGTISSMKSRNRLSVPFRENGRCSRKFNPTDRYQRLSVHPDMALYYITNADKDETGTITRVKASKDSKTAAGEIHSKRAMIDLLDPEGRNTAKTWYLQKSEDVKVVDHRYLRSDANNTKADNLGNLPRI